MKRFLSVFTTIASFQALPAQEETRPYTEFELFAELKTFEINDIETQAAATVPEFIAPEPSTRPVPKLADASLVASEKVIPAQGRTITIQRLTKAPARTPQTVTAKQALPDSQPSSKPHHTLFLSTTIYDHSLTELRWFHEGLEYRVFVNFDFTLLSGIGRIESQTAEYSLVLGIGEASLSDQILSVKQPAASPLPASESAISNLKSEISGTAASQFPNLQIFPFDRVIIHQAASNYPGIEKTTEFQALPDLISYLQTNESEIRWNQAVQKAENAARQRWLNANPPRPQNVVIQFWPIKNPVLPGFSK